MGQLLQLQERIDELTIEELRTLVEIMHGETRRRADMFWLTIYQKNTLFVGAQGTGKSICCVAFAHEINRLKADRKKTGPGVATIGPRVGLRKAFGAFQELDYDGMGDQLLRINEVAASDAGRDPEADEDDLVRAYKSHGVTIYGNVLIADEGYNVFSKRMTMAKENQAFANFGQTLRHIKATYMMASPRGELDIDDKMVNQIHYIGRPSIKTLYGADGKEIKRVQVYLHKAGTYDAIRKTAYGSHKVVHSFNVANFGGMYRTDMPVAIQERLLSNFRKRE